MKNIRIEADSDSHSILVRADSNRFGKNAIVYQDTTFMACFNYIAKTTGRKNFQLKEDALTVTPTWLAPGLPYVCHRPPVFTDAEGRTMPSELSVVFTQSDVS